MFQRLCTYFQYTGVLIFGGMYFRGIATDSKFQLKLKGYLFSEGYLFTGFYGNVAGECVDLLDEGSPCLKGCHASVCLYPPPPPPPHTHTKSPTVSSRRFRLFFPTISRITT